MGFVYHAKTYCTPDDLSADLHVSRSVGYRYFNDIFADVLHDNTRHVLVERRRGVPEAIYRYRIDHIDDIMQVYHSNGRLALATRVWINQQLV